jgi:hypothetical protein
LGDECKLIRQSNTTFWGSFKSGTPRFYWWQGVCQWRTSNVAIVDVFLLPLLFSLFSLTKFRIFFSFISCIQFDSHYFYIIFLIFYGLIFFFNSISYNLLSFNFYIKFNSHSFNYYLFFYHFSNWLWFLISSLNIWFWFFIWNSFLSFL